MKLGTFRRILEVMTKTKIPAPHEEIVSPFRLEILEMLLEGTTLQRDLAADLGVTDGTMSQHIGTLAYHGYVERGSRGRLRTVTLTARGKDAILDLTGEPAMVSHAYLN
jgi:DNA-binding MarR family transcriptional regulator